MSRVPPAMSTRLGTTTRKDVPEPTIFRFAMPWYSAAFLPSFYHGDRGRGRRQFPPLPAGCGPYIRKVSGNEPFDGRRTGDALCEDPVAGTFGILDPGRENRAGRPLARGKPRGGGGSGHGTDGGPPA